jgi:hypothetical protein
VTTAERMHPRTPSRLDPSKPTSARVYNCLLGGKDNYEIDQRVAERMRMVAPDINRSVWYSRRFLEKAVIVAAKADVRQFLNVGAGIPHTPEPHDVARGIQPDARTVAIDHDLMAFTHCNALYHHVPGVTAMRADIRDPDAILAELDNRGLIDFTQPVAVLMVGVLEYVTDDEDPIGIIARIRRSLVPGSYLAIAHASTGTCPELRARVDADTGGSTAETTWRSYEDIAEFLDAFTVLRPGLAPVQAWLDGDLPTTHLETLAAIACV